MAAFFAQCCIGFFEKCLEVGQGFDGRFCGDFKTFQLLGKFFHAVGKLVKWLATFFHESQDLQGGENAIASRCMIGKDQMARIFTTKGVLVLAKGLDDLAIADAGGKDFDARFFHRYVQAEVGHDGDGYGISVQFTALLECDGGECHDAITTDDIALSIGEDHAVCIAIKTHSEMCLVLFDECRCLLWVERGGVG